MTNLPSAIFRKWIHSHEVDSGGLTIYRPEDYPFPPARRAHGRESRRALGPVGTKTILWAEDWSRARARSAQGDL